MKLVHLFVILALGLALTAGLDHPAVAAVPGDFVRSSEATEAAIDDPQPGEPTGKVALTLADGTTHTVDMYNDSNKEGAMVGRIKLDAGQAFVGNKVTWNMKSRGVSNLKLQGILEKSSAGVMLVVKGHLGEDEDWRRLEKLGGHEELGEDLANSDTAQVGWGSPPPPPVPGRRRRASGSGGSITFYSGSGASGSSSTQAGKTNCPCFSSSYEDGQGHTGGGVFASGNLQVSRCGFGDGEADTCYSKSWSGGRTVEFWSYHGFGQNFKIEPWWRIHGNYLCIRYQSWESNVAYYNLFSQATDGLNSICIDKPAGHTYSQNDIINAFVNSCDKLEYKFREVCKYEWKTCMSTNIDHRRRRLNRGGNQWGHVNCISN